MSAQPQRVPVYDTIVPPHWELKTIDQLSSRVGSGVTPTGGSEVYTTEGVLFIRSQNVRFEGLDLDDVAFIEERIHRQMSGSKVFPHDVLINITGASIGRCCSVPDGLGEANQNQHVCTIRIHEADARDAKFLASTLSSPIGQGQISRLNAGGNREGLNYKQLRSFDVVWPPQPERYQIAEILTTVDRAIAQTEALIAKQQRLKTGLMQDLLTRGIDEHGNLRSELTHKFKDSPLGRIPVEWDITPLGVLADVSRGKFTHRPRNDPQFFGGEFPFIQTGDVTANIGRTLTAFSQTLNDRGTKISKCFPAGTIAITIAANIADTTLLGIPMYFPDSVVGAVVAAPHNIRFVELMIRRWKPILEQLAPQSAQRNINLETLRPLQIPTPSPEEQMRIGSLYDKIDAEHERLEHQQKKLLALKTALMQDLLTGRKRVTELLKKPEVRR